MNRAMTTRTGRIGKRGAVATTTGDSRSAAGKRRAAAGEPSAGKRRTRSRHTTWTRTGSPTRTPRKQGRATAGRRDAARRSTKTAAARRRGNATRRRASREDVNRGHVERRGAHRVDTAARALAKWMPALRKQGGRGVGAVLAVVEGGGRRWDVSSVVCDHTTPLAGRGAGKNNEDGPEMAGSRAARTLAAKVRPAELAALLAAMSSVHRLRILLKLLEGAATYRTLQKVTGLKAGPLYHHIANLRLASLVGPKQRDLYELTRAGRDVLMGTLMLGPLSRDRRRRPANYQ